MGATLFAGMSSSFTLIGSNIFTAHFKHHGQQFGALQMYMKVLMLLPKSWTKLM
jgi:hypothetical protein